MDENTEALALWKRLKRELKIDTDDTQDQDIVVEISKSLAKFGGTDVYSHTSVYNQVKISQQLSSLATRLENKKISPRGVVSRLRKIAEKIKIMP